MRRVETTFILSFNGLSCVDEENLSVNEKKRNMVKKLMRMEVSEQCAKAAVQSVGFDDEENCLIWALTNGTDCEELAKEFDDDIGMNRHGF